MKYLIHPIQLFLLCWSTTITAHEYAVSPSIRFTLDREGGSSKFIYSLTSSRPCKGLRFIFSKDCCARRDSVCFDLTINGRDCSKMWFTPLDTAENYPTYILCGSSSRKEDVKSLFRSLKASCLTVKKWGFNSNHPEFWNDNFIFIPKDLYE